MTDEIKRARCISDLQKFHRENKRVPYSGEFGCGFGVPGYRLLKRLFGSVAEALVAAGLNPRAQGHLNRKKVYSKQSKAKRALAQIIVDRKRIRKRPLIGRDYQRIETPAKEEYKAWERRERAEGNLG